MPYEESFLDANLTYHLQCLGILTADVIPYIM